LTRREPDAELDPGSSDPRDVIARKRDGHAVPEADLRRFVEGYASGDIPDHQAAAFVMAAFIRGLDVTETVALTRATVESGSTLGLEGVTRPKVDKHSTGGVADGVTLVFAPLGASLGLAVAKLSGRGLGHTGGTLDKLESISGLRTDLSLTRFERQVEEVGCAVAAQTPDIVPADGALYALRDATATVPSIPLIAASVMSKKLAVGSDLILLDVKAGGGAFMKTQAQARELAQACVSLAQRWGRACRAAITDMSQPLGEAIGNALDVAEAVDVLSGRHRGRLRDAAVVFAGEAVSRLTGEGMGQGRQAAAEALDDGRALEAFGRMVEAQGGERRVVDDPWAVLPRAPVVRSLEADRGGVLRAVDAEALGRASVDLGAGRHRKGDPIDPAVGIVFWPKIGDRLERGRPIAEIHARDEEDAARGAARVVNAMTISDDDIDPPPLVYDWFGG
jgi:pyrimidine-nucleoside phosphorylase